MLMNDALVWGKSSQVPTVASVNPVKTSLSAAPAVVAMCHMQFSLCGPGGC